MSHSTEGRDNMDDLISRQAAIHLIAGYDGVIDKSVAKRLLIQMTSAQPEQQWIPCSERLPDKKDDYLCSYNGCAVADICEYDPDRNEWGFFYDGGWKVVSNVIAWMPLPEPYKAERLEE